MGRKQGERVLGQAKAIHAELNSQSIKQTVWVYAKKEKSAGEQVANLKEQVQ